MLDLFTIFSKGGIVLWCFQSTSQAFTSSVNALIRNVILQERTGVHNFDHDGLTLQYKLDNEFDLVFVVAYQKILQLSYVDKFLNDVHLEFRDKYKNDLADGRYFQEFDFVDRFNATLQAAEQWGKTQAKAPKAMRTFEQSNKSKKTVASMIERKGEEKKQKKKEVNFSEEPPKTPPSPKENNHVIEEDVIAANRAKFAQKMNKKKSEPKKSPKPAAEKAGKKPRIWDLGGTNKDLETLERTTDKPEDIKSHFTPDTEIVGKMKGVIKDLEVESSSDEEYEEEEAPSQQTKPASRGGMFSIFKGLVGSKNLTAADMQPALDKMKDHLIAKNVAADIAIKLCESVALKLEGKVLGTFESVASTVKSTLTESLVQILSPKRRVDILRDCMEAQRSGRPYVMTFCGVNGVGKSTNLAKICFWLIENNMRVLIAACDTFRAGAVEQLRTHMRHLNALHPPERHGGRQMVQLYEKGYGKDAAGIAMEAIKYATDSRFDVVLIDTAGRMQDNEPLMRALTKLIKVNEPDLVLFVGEALVGNEAVDQLVKFNQALADYSSSSNPHIIDGIVLTKFDTIDDKVGAAISMTYITGQPIVFVGTGQTYTDLKALNAKAVVHSLMK
ncbi:signal recognition particle receptor subunit alpha homolog [Tribolium castaneum]|uniref:Signal recognition particle receptor subunit alpha homolog-like Protein n=1 Tax=Tribolium castaneum TaxID=7070 RepID=D2A3J6_TRICA|nr:PREDICTED: signal recognition particle receptor subunit alpha homolog [Tribolium castaneum]EFA02325.1 Signal recognition particle receptor subunit alpha homolog-like Protein [Tribolium castaneum]|eukprot:XP_001807129.1 PREDICTED: signal recognition particle receptor subunit alpha homolog [Tribolium castaneum]